MSTRCLALLGPGLDGQLAIELMRRAGVEVFAVTLSTPFTNYRDAVAASAARMNTPLIPLAPDASYYERIRHPRFGYTREMAPCLDCKVAMLTMAREQMLSHGAEFLVTGDVVGQRLPGQSKRDFALVDFHAATEGLVLRPLSAKLLPTTMAQQQGLVPASSLLDLQGRGRQRQQSLAQQWRIPEPPAVSSGCLLADAAYGRKYRDAIVHADDARESLDLLAIGRHFRLSPSAKVIVGRNAQENAALSAAHQAAIMPHAALIEPHQFIGPTCLATNGAAEQLVSAALLALRYTRKKADVVWYEFRVTRQASEAPEIMSVQDAPIDASPL